MLERYRKITLQQGRVAALPIQGRSLHILKHTPESAPVASQRQLESRISRRQSLTDVHSLLVGCILHVFAQRDEVGGSREGFKMSGAASSPRERYDWMNTNNIDRACFNLPPESRPALTKEKRFTLSSATQVHKHRPSQTAWI